MIVLVTNLNYKCYWEDGILIHIFIVDGAQLKIGEWVDDWRS